MLPPVPLLPVPLPPTDAVVVLEDAVTTTTGPLGLLVVLVYSFLIAIALPLPSEVVLLAPLQLGIGSEAQLAAVIVVSGVGKAAGSLVALRMGHHARGSGVLGRFLVRRGVDLVELSERVTGRLAERWGYLGLACALSVPGFPDTLSIYAFSVLGEDYGRFAAASFTGSVGRLVITVVAVGGAAAVL